MPTRSPFSGLCSPMQLLRRTRVSLPPDVPDPEPDETAPTLGASSFDTDTVSLTSDEAGTLYWTVSDTASPSAAAVKSGADGSFAVTSGVTDEEIDVSGVATGEHYLHLMVEDAAGNQSAVDSTLYVFPGSAPAQFGASDWSVADEESGGTLTVTISALPDEGSDPITDIDYRVDGGSWIATGLDAPGSFDIDGLSNDTSYDVQLRAVNAAGDGSASAVKSATPTGAAPSATDKALVVSGGIPAGLEAEVPAATLPVTVFGWVYCTTGNTNPTVWAGEAGRDQVWMSGGTAETLNARTLSGTAVTVATGAGLNEWVPFRVTYRATAPYVTVETPAGTATGGGGGSDEITALGTHWVGQDDGADANFPGRLFDIGVKAGEHTLAQLNYVDNAGTPNWTDFADSDPAATYEYRLRGDGANPGTDSLGQNDFSQSAGGGSTTLDEANVPAGANT